MPSLARAVGFVFFGLVLGLFGARPVRAQALRLELDEDTLRIQSPGLRFIEGPSLARLENGRSVTYLFELTATGRPGGREISRSELRFTVSYDLWEERFAVARDGEESTAISHLTSREAEDWCLESLGIPVGRFPPDPFWIRLEYRVEESEADPENDDDSVFTLGGLIDTLSRRSSGAQPSGSVESGPFRLEDLR